MLNLVIRKETARLWKDNFNNVTLFHLQMYNVDVKFCVNL
jgi:hypothetical protein